MKSAEVFREIGERLKSQPDVPKKVQAILLYVIKQGGKEVAEFSKSSYLNIIIVGTKQITNMHAERLYHCADPG